MAEYSVSVNRSLPELAVGVAAEDVFGGITDAASAIVRKRFEKKN